MSKKFLQVSALALCGFAIEATHNSAFAIADCYKDFRQECFTNKSCDVFGKAGDKAFDACNVSKTQFWSVRCADGCNIKKDEGACEGSCSAKKSKK